VAGKRKKGRETLLSEIVAALVGLPVVVTPLLLIEWLFGSRLFSYFYLTVFALFTVIYLGYSLQPNERLLPHIERDLKMGKAGDFYLFGLPLLYFVSFVLLSRSIWLLEGGSAFRETPEHVWFFTWVGYSADCLLGVVLFDAPEIYGFRFTSVEHQKTFWISTLVFVYKTTLAIGFIKILVLSYSGFVRKSGLFRDVPPEKDAPLERDRR
jgi:hypothetical protein